MQDIRDEIKPGEFPRHRSPLDLQALTDDIRHLVHRIGMDDGKLHQSSDLFPLPGHRSETRFESPSGHLAEPALVRPVHPFTLRVFCRVARV